jgi:glycosyltransferase involved in cell wall biosynthesis
VRRKDQDRRAPHLTQAASNDVDLLGNRVPERTPAWRIPDGSETPLVSVVIPTYNSGQFIEPAIESALGQTLADIEVLVIDDGSTDGTVARLKRFDDPRLRIYEQPHRGAPSALNAGVNLARAPYIGFLDHDDVWAPEKLARHIEYFEKNAGADVTFSWSALMDESGSRMELHPAHWRGPIDFSQLLEDFVVGSTSSVVLRRSAILRAGGFDVYFPRCHDADLLLRIALGRPQAICAIPEELTWYRRHSGQMSRDWRAMRREWYSLLDKLRNLAPAETAGAERRARSNMNRYYACLAYEEAQFSEAYSLVRESLRSDAFAFIGDWRNWKVAAACCCGVLLPGPIHRWLEELAGIHQPRVRRGTGGGN